MNSIHQQILNRDIVLSYSSLSHFRKSPEHFIHYKMEGIKDTDATKFGRALHCYALQWSEFSKKFVVWDDSQRPDPSKNYQTKINNEWKKNLLQAYESQHITVIEKDDFEKIKVMSDKLHDCSPAKELIEYTRSKYEERIEFTRKNLKIKSFIDIRSDLFLTEIKTTLDADPLSFSREIYKRGYDLQGAVYNDADKLGHVTFQTLKEFYFIAIEKTAPYGVSVHRFFGKPLEFALEEYFHTLDDFNKCLDAPERFLRSYDYYATDQVNKVFSIELPYWKTTLV